MLGDNFSISKVNKDPIIDDDDDEEDEDEIAVTEDVTAVQVEEPSVPFPSTTSTKNCGKRVLSIKLRPILQWLTTAPTEKVHYSQPS